MLILNSTTQLLRVVTSVAADVDVVASYVDRNGTTFTPGNNGGVSITTATTTTVVASPAASTERNIKAVTIRNKDTTDTTLVTVQWYDGVNAFVLIAESLAPGEEIYFDSQGSWTVTGRLPRMTKTVLPGPLGKWGEAFIGGVGAFLTGRYNTPKGATSLFVECVGGGGNGGDCTTAATNSAAAGGGGSGERVIAIVTSPNANYQWAIAHRDRDFGVGTNQDDTFFGVTAWSLGGVPTAALVSARSGTNGANDAVATIHIGGAAGTSYSGQAGTGYALAAAQCIAGHGGSGPYGVGAWAFRNGTRDGREGEGWGAGGCGASIVSGGASTFGGLGSPGIIIVTEFYA